ncbi:apolipoprotein D-like [Battus philenor]|uniref:apolipoprotein D-like n=1 Tax=Battus philenor TaxID=42288 RepID=UPI0035D09AD4
MGDFRLWGSILYSLLALRHVFATGLGKCPVYPRLPDFDIQKMLGTWYEVERSFYLMEMAASCTQLNVELNERGHLLITIDTTNRWTGSATRTRGVGVLSHAGASTFRYRVNSRVPYMIGRLLPGAGQYVVLDTDYDQFALLWSCTSLTVAHSDRMWVLGRRRELGVRLRARVYGALLDRGLDPDRLILSKNNHCIDYNTTSFN